MEFATIWSLEFLNFQVQPYNEYNTKIVLSEIGWPSGGGTFGSSVASLSNLEYFANDFCVHFEIYQLSIIILKHLMNHGKKFLGR